MPYATFGSVRAGLSLVSRATLGKDLGAGVTLGLVSVPDGLAAGLLAGLNPVAGLYGYLVGTVTGALTTSSVFMTVQATGAMAVLIADVPEVRGQQDSAAALVTLTVMTGLVMLTMGLLRLGSMVRFVSNAVLTGFINAVAVNIVLGQLADFTGYDSDAANRLTRGLDTVFNVANYDWPTLAIGVTTLLLILGLERTFLGPLGLFVAVVATSGLVAVLGLTSVPVLADTAEIPSSLPLPVLPDLSLLVVLFVPALALAFVGLVQGAAISQSVPNPDGDYPDVSGDFRGQGVANIASGVLQGMPVGGSMSGTALTTAAGAAGRAALLIAGAVMVLVILVAGELAGAIAMPALAALLILVGVRTFKPDQVQMVWRTGAAQATVMSTTFVLTLLIPLQYAVLAGVAISVILFVTRQSNRVKVVRWTFNPGSPLPHEQDPSLELGAADTVVLNVYGSLFFASAPVFAEQLPQATPACRGSVVVLRLRGKDDLGSTFIRVITRYAEQLADVGSHLVVSGVGQRALRQLEMTGALEALGRDNVFPAEPSVGTSLAAALARADHLRGQPPQ